MHEKLKTGLEAMGLRCVVEESTRLPQINSIYVPEGVDEAAIRTRLLAEFCLEIGAGLGDMAGNIWRIGLMGYWRSRKTSITASTRYLPLSTSHLGSGRITACA